MPANQKTGAKQPPPGLLVKPMAAQLLAISSTNGCAPSAEGYWSQWPSCIRANSQASQHTQDKPKTACVQHTSVLAPVLLGRIPPCEAEAAAAARAFAVLASMLRSLEKRADLLLKKGGGLFSGWAVELRLVRAAAAGGHQLQAVYCHVCEGKAGVSISCRQYIAACVKKRRLVPASSTGSTLPRVLREGWCEQQLRTAPCHVCEEKAGVSSSTGYSLPCWSRTSREGAMTERGSSAAARAE
eukprot:1157222-Pelagomonas_calceolata.AAC.13